MPKYRLYAGMGGSFGGAHFCETVEAHNKEEAEKMAYDLAVEEYESYGGYHGLYTWDSMREELANEYYDGDVEAVPEEDVDLAYTEEIEGWISWYVKEVPDSTPLGWDEDGDDDDYDDDDADCYCE